MVVVWRDVLNDVLFGTYFNIKAFGPVKLSLPGSWPSHGVNDGLHGIPNTKCLATFP
jgi:hypothetical protein